LGRSKAKPNLLLSFPIGKSPITPRREKSLLRAPTLGGSYFH
jgi:hypothetical protein